MLEGSDDFFQRKTAVISRYIPPGSGRSFRLPATAMTSPAPSDKGMRPSAHGIFPSTTISSWKFQRAGPDPDQQFIRPWFGMIFLDQFEIFQASRRSQPNQLHEYPFFLVSLPSNNQPITDNQRAALWLAQRLSVEGVLPKWASCHVERSRDISYC